MGGDHTEKTTIMVLKVDLQCPSCYNKAKKVLCKFPQVRDQVYDEKANTITITVVCCSPERIRDKLCYKGGKTIKSIDIKAPAKPKEPEKPKGPEKPKESEKPKGPDQKPKDSGKPKVVTFEKPKEKTKEPEKPTVIEKPKPKEAAMVATPWAAEPMVMMPPVQGYPQVATGCGCGGQCYYTPGPCYQHYGTPIPQQQPSIMSHVPYGVPQGPYYDNYSYAPSAGYGRGSNVGGDYFSDENASGCTIM